MLDYFLSSDWAIIATELLAGFFVITVILAVMLWRGQRRHADAAERLLDDRKPILKATEEMVSRQIERIWPGMTLDEEQRQTYADRSLDAVEAMVEPWLEPKRHDLSTVARQFQRVRQEDLEQLLSLARAHAEASQADDARVTELEQELNELRAQRDRQANHLNDSLETVNVMVREYGRKFDYNEEPHIATVLKAIVMVQEMAAGADCETAQERAEAVFSEDLVASAAPAEETAPAEQDNAPAEESAAAPPDAAAQMVAAMEMEAAGSREPDSIDVGGEQTGREDTTETGSSDAPKAAADDTSETPQTQSTPPAEDEASGGDDDIDALISQAQESKTATTAATEAMSSPAEATGENADDESGTPAPEEPTTTRETADDATASPAPASAPDTTAADRSDTATSASDENLQQPATADAEKPDTSSDEDIENDEEAEDNSVIDLDDVEIPEEDQEQPKGQADEYDLDDIDALLDAEIAKKHGKSSG